MTDAEKLAMVERALVDLVESVGCEPVVRLSRKSVEAFHKAQSALDALAFVNKMGERT